MNTKQLNKKKLQQIKQQVIEDLIKTDIGYQLLVIDTATEIYNTNISIIRHARNQKNLSEKSKEILNGLIQENKQLRPLLEKIN